MFISLISYLSSLNGLLQHENKEHRNFIKTFILSSKYSQISQMEYSKILLYDTYSINQISLSFYQVFQKDALDGTKVKTQKIFIS